MKKDGKYRFSLQFGTDSEEQIRAGELLERLGNRKSQIVVAALNDYLAAHPDLQNGGCKVEVKLTSGYDRKSLEKIVRSIVEEKMNSTATPNIHTEAPVTDETAVSDDDIARMLDNLDIFN